ncbi:DUF6498-containing protein [Polaribacter sp. MSW13]|uniref:DUF6498-containing protein n=1 Tax=Polaribacter marinus TaxID=2916838 RepID=A0A9X1VQ15_9FLAO|nr:DUF6498-containing protein [Polaribacter marinus]MCI2229718.1 DUF6498-containing protein [Polaribacter marinus]
MLKDILYPTKQNAFIWLSSIYLLFLLYIGKASTMSILFVYFLETLIIGVFNALKMLWCIRYSKSKGKKSESYGLILFFLFHYGFFVAIQSIFGFALFGMEANEIIKEPFHIIDNYIAILNLEDVRYALPAIIFMHLGKFISDYLKNEKYKTFTAQEIMFKPYVRIFIQQFVVILSFFFIVFGEAGAGIIAAILLIFFRLLIDLVLESIKQDSKILDKVSEKLANEKASKEEIKKQLIIFTE